MGLLVLLAGGDGDKAQGAAGGEGDLGGGGGRQGPGGSSPRARSSRRTGLSGTSGCAWARCCAVVRGGTGRRRDAFDGHHGDDGFGEREGRGAQSGPRVQGLGDDRVHEEGRRLLRERDVPQVTEVVRGGGQVPGDGCVSVDGRRGRVRGAPNHGGVPVVRDESGEPEVVEVAPGVDVDVQLKQARLGADAVDDVIRVGGKFSCQGADERGDELDRHIAVDVRPPRSGACSSVRAEITRWGPRPTAV